ncbi:MAG: hypothetical protein ACOYL6_01635 [Bacteriovoracaceae bacterium]
MARQFSLFIYLILSTLIASSAVAADKYKIKYVATIIYTEPDGTKFVLPEAKGKIWMRKTNGACIVRVGGWESDIEHVCRLKNGEKGLAPTQVEFSDNTLVTMLLESLKFLLENKYGYALKIFTKSNVYINDQLIETRPINQSTVGSFFLNFNEPNRITLEQLDFKNKIKVELRFNSLRRTLKKRFD